MGPMIRLPEEPHEEKARLLRRETNGSVDLEAGVQSVESLPEAQSRSVSEDTTTSPLMSPTSAESPGIIRPSARPSEKARGKMRAGRSMSMSNEMTGSLERIAAAGIGRNGFVPTQEWVCSPIYY